MRSSLPLWSLLVTTGALATPLEIQVLDAKSGAPIAGVDLTIRSRSGASDAQGKATFDEVSSGDTLVLDHGDYLHAERKLTSASLSRPLTIRLTPNRDLSKDLSLHGTATNIDGSAMPGRVSVRCGITARETNVDETGQFVVQHLAPGRCTLLFYAAGDWRGATQHQYFTLNAQTPPISIGPRAESVDVNVRVEGAVRATDVFIVAGDARKAPRSCWFYNDGTGGVGVVVGDTGFVCAKRGLRYVCPSIPPGVYTVIARTTLDQSAISWSFNEWRRRITVGTTPVFAKMGPFPFSAPRPNTGRSALLPIMSRVQPIFPNRCGP